MSLASVWRRLRVWVVGANDGIIATAGLLQGFAGAGADNLLLLDLQLSTIRTFSSSGFLSAPGLLSGRSQSVWAPWLSATWPVLHYCHRPTERSVPQSASVNLSARRPCRLGPRAPPAAISSGRFASLFW